jgi:hypothetical protein
VTLWGIAGAAYGVVLALAALTQPIRRRHLAFVASVAFTLASLAAGTLVEAFWINLLVPGALLLGGYWLSGFFFRDPQPWLETWLLRVDHAVGAERWMDWASRPTAELLEFSYTMAYAVVGGGAIYAATVGTDAVAYYWSLVLASELAAFAPMPWLRSRPPRVIEGAGTEGAGTDGWLADVGIRAKPAFRRLNTLILEGASIQANTLPSGHVSGAVAAAFGVMAVDIVVGSWLMVAAGLIAVAAIAGRYHYVVDCVAGAAVALAFSSLM